VVVHVLQYIKHERTAKSIRRERQLQDIRSGQTCGRASPLESGDPFRPEIEADRSSLLIVDSRKRGSGSASEIHDRPSIARPVSFDQGLNKLPTTLEPEVTSFHLRKPGQALPPEDAARRQARILSGIPLASRSAYDAFRVSL
jgi:hypothetical protein